MDEDIEKQLIVIEEGIEDLDKFATAVQRLRYDSVACQHTLTVAQYARRPAGSSRDVLRFLSQRFKG